MAMGTETSGYPVVLSNGGSNDGFGGGMGNIGALLLGSLIFGRNGGLGGFGGAGGGGYVPGAVEGSQLGQLNGLQTQISGLQSTVNQNSVTGEINALQSAITNGQFDLLTGIKDNANVYLQGQAALQTAQASANFTTLQSINGLGQVFTAQNNQNALQQLNSFNQLNTTTLQGFNEISRDNANSFNQLTMGQNALSAQMAACCCSIEKTITNDGNDTRALINNLYVQNLQGQLADAKTQNSTLSQTITQQAITNAQTATILNHLRPFPTTVV